MATLRCVGGAPLRSESFRHSKAARASEAKKAMPDLRTFFTASVLAWIYLPRPRPWLDNSSHQSPKRLPSLLSLGSKRLTEAS
jgi:hypothetical protein